MPFQREAAEFVGDVFRAVMPFALAPDVETNSIAAPLLAAGMQGGDPVVMLRAIFRAATHWFARGLPVEVIKIVLMTDVVKRLRQEFEKLCSETPAGVASVEPASPMGMRDAHAPPARPHGVSPVITRIASSAGASGFLETGSEALHLWRRSPRLS